MHNAEERAFAAEKHDFALWQSTMVLIQTCFFILAVTIYTD